MKTMFGRVCSRGCSAAAGAMRAAVRAKHTATAMRRIQGRDGLCTPRLRAAFADLARLTADAFQENGTSHIKTADFSPGTSLLYRARLRSLDPSPQRRKIVLY